MVAPEQVLRTLQLLRDRPAGLAIELLGDPNLGLCRVLAAGELGPDGLVKWLTRLDLITVQAGRITIAPLGAELLHHSQADDWKDNFATATFSSPACRSLVLGLADRARINAAGAVALKPGANLQPDEQTLLFLYRRLDLADFRDGQWLFFGDVGNMLATTIEQRLPPEVLFQRLREQRLLGEFGEKLVMALEADRLRALGAPHLVPRIRRISLENVAAGYDIQSFNGPSSVLPDRFVEVKTTTATHPRFFFQRGEVQKAKERGPTYHLACVLGADLATDSHTRVDWFPDPAVSVLQSPNFHVEAASFEVTWVGA